MRCLSITLVLAIAIALACPAAAADREAKARRLAELQFSGLGMVQSFDQSVIALKQAARRQNPHIPSSEVDVIFSEATEEIQTMAAQAKATLGNMYLAAFTEDELDKYLEFFGSEPGKHWVGASSPIMMDLSRLMIARTMEIAQRLQPKAVRRAREMGYELILK